MRNKRTTIYDLAKALGVSPSYVSKALNNHPAISERVKESVKKIAGELNYKHNSHAANLRQGSSKTMGVIVPHINQSFFSEAISGIEEVCSDNHYSLIICQSHESLEKEKKAVDTLIHQNVDCILISISAETQSYNHLEAIKKNNIELVQFDRCTEMMDSYKVSNDNQQAAREVVKLLIEEGYSRIAFLGGPEQLMIFKSRKEGYLQAIREAGLSIPYDYIVDNALEKNKAAAIAVALLQSGRPPDAFLTVSDHQSLGIVEAAASLGIRVGEQLGVFGFANESFTELVKPTLSSVDQQSKEMGKRAAALYFHNIQGTGETAVTKEETIRSKIIVRQSSQRRFVPAK